MNFDRKVNQMVNGKDLRLMCTRGCRSSLTIILTYVSVCVLLVALTGPAYAETSKYDELFDRIEALGAVSVSNMVYVKVDGWGSRARNMLPYDYVPSGNAWMICETNDAAGKPLKSTVMINGSEILEIQFGRERDVLPDERKGEIYGTWRKADLKRDAGAAVRCIKGVLKSQYPDIYLKSVERGRLVLFALRLRQTGDVAGADRIMDALTGHLWTAGTLQAEALNVLGDGRYHSLYHQFRKDSDWVIFHDRLKDLTARMGKDWGKGAGAQVLIDKIADRIGGKLPQLEGTNEFSKADIELSRRVPDILYVNKTKWMHGALVPLWIVPDTWVKKNPPGDDVDLQLRARGVEAIPLLLALLNDDTLTLAHLKGADDGWRSRNEQRGSGDAVFSAMDRPATVGEVAKHILSEIMPGKNYLIWEQKNSSPDTVKNANAFYSTFKDAAPAALAMEFVGNSDAGEVISAAEGVVLTTAAQEPVPAFEELLRSSKVDDPYYADKAVTRFARYAAQRGPSCAPMGRRLESTLRERSQSYNASSGFAADDTQRRERWVAEKRAEFARLANELKRIDYDATTDELIDCVIESMPGTNSIERTMLLARLRFQESDQALRLLLNEAVSRTDGQQRSASANVISEMIKGNRDLYGAGPGAPAVPEGGDADHWKVLIGDTSSIEGTDALVCDQFMWLNEEIYAPAPEEKNYDYMYWAESGGAQKNGFQILRGGVKARDVIHEYGERGRELVRTRILARLKGLPEKDLPLYTDDYVAPPEQVERLRTKLREAKSRSEAEAAVKKIQIYDIAAMLKLLREDHDLNMKLTAFANTVTSVTVSDGLEKERLSGWEGDSLTPSHIEELRSICDGYARTNKAVECLINRADAFGGCALIVRAISDKELTAGMPNREPELRRIIGIAGLVVSDGLL